MYIYLSSRYKRQPERAEPSVSQEAETTYSANSTSYEKLVDMSLEHCPKETCKIRGLDSISLQVVSSFNILLRQLCSSNYEHFFSELAGPRELLKKKNIIRN